MRKYILMAALSAPLICNAETWIDIPVTSMHSSNTYISNGVEKDINQNNPGLGISSAYNEHIEFIAGYYRNSFNNDSGYAGADFHTSSKRAVRVGISTGLITGYNYPVAAMPNVVFSNDNVRIKIGGFPPYQDSPGAITFSIGIKL